MSIPVAEEVISLTVSVRICYDPSRAGSRDELVADLVQRLTNSCQLIGVSTRHGRYSADVVGVPQVAK